MTREEAKYYLQSSGFSEEQIDTIEKAFTSTDAISRQAVLDAIDVKAWEFCDYLISKNRNDEQKPVSHFADNLRECVREELPSVNAQPKTGHWISHHHGCEYECSECHDKQRAKSNYCPNCGCRMVEPQESEDK